MTKKFQRPSHCPKCGKSIKSEDYRRYKSAPFDLVIHEIKIGLFGFQEVTKSCYIQKGESK